MNRKSRARKKTSNYFKIIFIFIFAIFIIVVPIFLYQRYSFTKERVDLNEYIGVSGDDILIYINDVNQFDIESGKMFLAYYYENQAYLPLSFVKEKLNNRFYFAKDVNKIVYCLTDEVLSFGESDFHQVGNAPYIVMRDEPYLLIDYVKDYTNIYYDKYLDSENKRIFIYNDWAECDLAYIKSNEALRIRGGNKSPIVVDLNKGEEVKILDKMTKWSKVKSQSGFMGYVRNTRLFNENTYIPQSTFNEEVRPKNRLDEKVVLAFHQLFSNFRTNSLNDVVKNAKNDVNVLIPTWYSIRGEDGDIRSLASAEYVQQAHNKGYKVWGMFDNFNVGNYDEKAIFSSTLTRKKMIEKLIREINVANLDGINVDIEGLKSDEGEDFIEFIRELSVELLKINKTLSVDTYVPYSYNLHYDLNELNYFCDYVVIMCYDEHYAGSKEAGSVSSISYVKDGIELTLEKVDKDKIVIALPFYTRVWFTDKNGKLTSQAVDAKTAENSVINRNMTTVYDEQTEQNYASVVNSDGSKVECWLEDETSLTNKINLIKSYDLSGTGAWKITFEKEDFFRIINLNR